MFKIYTPCDKDKRKALRLWKDESGKVFKDSIRFVYCNDRKSLNRVCNKLFDKGELCVFFEHNQKAFIKYPNKIITLSKRKLIPLSNENIKKELNQYGGLTINDGLIEVWYD